MAEVYRLVEYSSLFKFKKKKDSVVNVSCCTTDVVSFCQFSLFESTNVCEFEGFCLRATVGGVRRGG